MADEPVQETKDASSSVESSGGGADVWTSRVTVIVLALVLLISVAGLLGLPLLGKDAPDQVTNMATMIIGVLAALLSPLSTKK